MSKKTSRNHAYQRIPLSIKKNRIEILKQNTRGKIRKNMEEKCKQTLNHTEGWKKMKKV